MSRSYQPMLRTKEALKTRGRNSRPSPVRSAAAWGFLGGVIFGAVITVMIMLQFIN